MFFDFFSSRQRARAFWVRVIAGGRDFLTLLAPAGGEEAGGEEEAEEAEAATERVRRREEEEVEVEKRASSANE